MEKVKPNKIHNDGKNYAYITKAGIMHITDERVGAERNSANGKILEVAVPCSGGWANVDGQEIMVYGEDDMRIDPETSVEAIPELAELYRQCK